MKSDVKSGVKSSGGNVDKLDVKSESKPGLCDRVSHVNPNCQIECEASVGRDKPSVLEKIKMYENMLSRTDTKINVFGKNEISNKFIYRHTLVRRSRAISAAA